MRLLLVGAELSFSEWISRSLSTQGFAIEDALTRTEQSAKSDFAAIIVDFEARRSQEAASIRKLRHVYGSVPILALTGADADARVRSLRGGANDCLAKPIAIPELVERLRLLLRHSYSPSDCAIRVKGLVLDSANREIEVKGKHHILRSREATILEVLMTKPNRIVSKERLEIDLYGASTEKTSNAVEVGIHRLRKNLAEAGADVTIETARSAGYILRESKRD